MKCVLPLTVGVEIGPHTSQCTCSKDFVVRVTLTGLTFCVCLAWMHKVHNELSFLYLEKSDHSEAGFM
jgi:hypothetical protein